MCVCKIYKFSSGKIEIDVFNVIEIVFILPPIEAAAMPAFDSSGSIPYASSNSATVVLV